MSNAPLPVVATSELIPKDELLEAFADFLEIDVGAGDASTDTLVTYQRQLLQFLNWCDRHTLYPAAITKEDIKKYRR
ncbi:MAG: hypothetical protein HC920_20290 [Oscillatoriales cyanobacterium SM2_3_0]|nr:hypothetical protein [Oscillatoriales cyanobacterium SM2_3_0]